LESGAVDVLRRLCRPEFVYPCVVFLASILLYSWTLAPTVTLVDSGELIIAAHSLGVAHPPGFPLYIMLAHAASVVPIGNVAQRVHFASATFAALASSITVLVVIELIKTTSTIAARRKLKKKSSHPSKKLLPPVSPSFLALAPALAAGLVVACSRTLWSYATIAEVYTLNILLMVIVCWLLFKWRRRIVENEKWHTAKHPPVILAYDGLLYVAAAVFGLALGVHHVTVALILPALAALVWKTQGFGFFVSRRLLLAALVSFLALVAVYSYLPWAAARSPIINWGNPRSLTAIWWHITGRQYQVFLSFDSQIVGQELLNLGRFLLREFGYWWLPMTSVLGLIGFSQLFKYDRPSFWFLTLVVLADAAYGVSYVIAEDKDAYYLPLFISMTIAAGFGLRRLLDWLQSKWLPRAWVPVTVSFLVLLLPASALGANWPFNNRRHYFIAHDYVDNMLGSMEPNGLLLTLDWQVVAPFFYVQEIEQRRRDVKVVDINLLRRSWYFDYLQRSYPELISRSQDRVDTFTVELKQWEHDPGAYARDAKLTQRIATAFDALIRSFVRHELEVAPVYLTSDLLFQAEEQEQEIAQWLSRNYQLIPHGLFFKLETERGFHDPGALQLQLRGLTDGTLNFESDDVVKQKVLPAYKAMLVNRGRYYSLFDKHELAIEAFQQALRLDPNLTAAQQGLNDSIAKLGGAP
jgi:tetratricopeptide (TPR) repeat protein